MWILIWRYLWRSPRPVVRWLLRLSFAGLLLSGWAWLVVASVFNGFSAFLETVFQRADPQIRLVGRGLTDSLRQALEARPEVEVAAGVYERVAILRYGGRQAVVRLRLVDERYPKVSRIGTQLLWGDNFPMRPRHALIGAGVASQLALADLKEEALWVYVIPSGRRIAFMGMEGLLKQRIDVQGIFSVQKEYDDTWVIARQSDWTSFRDLAYDVIELHLAPSTKIENFIKTLRRELYPSIEVQDPRRQHEGLYRVLAQEKVLARIGLFFLLLMTLMGVVSTLSAFLLLGRRDWALYQALGASPSWIHRLLQGLAVALLLGATGAGLLLGTIVVILQDTFRFIKLRGGEGFLLEYFPVRLAVEDYLWLLALISGVAVLLSLYMRYQLGRIDLRSALQGD
ncbi:MAG: hypothetical protein N3E49_02670 [Bacteroidia bacterium]|nr:hypothetical protein [Bacteroidia bacterium]